MVVSKSDSVWRKLLWWGITLLLELLTLGVLCGIPLLLMIYAGAPVWPMVLLFLGMAWVSHKICNHIENRIGMFCSLQNPNRANLVRLEIPMFWWRQRKDAPAADLPKKHVRRKKKAARVSRRDKRRKN